MAVLPLSQQNGGGARLSHPQLSLKRKETGDFPLPNKRVLLEVPLLPPGWPLMWCMNSLQASTYPRHIQTPDWDRDITRGLSHSSAAAHSGEIHPVCHQGFIVSRKPGKNDLMPLLSSPPSLEPGGIRDGTPRPSPCPLSSVCVWWWRGGVLFVA